MSRVLFLMKIERNLFSGLPPMIFFSAFGHIIFFSFALIFSALLPERAHSNDFEFRVSLTSFAVQSSGGGASPAKIPVSKTVATPPSPPAAKKKEAIKINESKKKSISQEKKKAPEVGTAEAKNPTGGDQSIAGNAGMGMSGSITGDPGGISIEGGADFEYAWYRSTVMSKLKESWMRPVAQFSDSAGLQCSISFSILRDGAVAEILVDASSGFPALDRSAVRAVQDSAPFPPLPSQFGGDSLKARFIFELKPE